MRSFTSYLSLHIFHFISFSSYLSLHIFQFMSFTSYLSLHIFHFVSFSSYLSLHIFSSYLSLHIFQFISFTSYLSVHIFHFISFSSYLSVHIFQFISFTSYLSVHIFHFISSHEHNKSWTYKVKVLPLLVPKGSVICRNIRAPFWFQLVWKETGEVHLDWGWVMTQSYSLLHLTLTSACNGHCDHKLPQSGLENYSSLKTVQKSMTEKSKVCW